MGNMNTDPDWMFDEYGRREYLSQPEGRVATDEERREAQRRNEQERKKREAERLKELGQEGKDEHWVFWAPLKIGLAEAPVLVLLIVLFAWLDVSIGWVLGIVLWPLFSLGIWSQNLTEYIYSGKDVWKQFWICHLIGLVMIPLFGFRMWLLFGLLAVVGVFLKLMLGRR